jgi:hypothetical protein
MSLLRRSIVAALACAVVLAVAVVPVSAEPWPVRSLSIFARTALGITKTGPFTELTKWAGFGQDVTWRFATDPVLGWQSLTIERAEKRADGTWGPFVAVGSAVIDDTGVAFYAMSATRPRTVSIRALFPASSSVTTNPSRSPARQAVWMATPPRPLALASASALGGTPTFTAGTKTAALGQTVTWRWIGPAKAAHQWAAVWIAERAPSGLWGPFVQAGEVIQFDGRGVATYQARYTTPTWIAVQIYLPAGSPPVPETWSAALQARWR